MNPQNQDDKRTVRNLAIFAGVVASSGWLGYGVDRLLNAPPTVQPGLLLWLIAPLVTVLLLRAFAGDGWKDFGLRPAFKGNVIWYMVSLLIYPSVGALVLLIGGIFRLVTFPNFSLVLLFSVFRMGLIQSFVKNIFEEFSWRGYLTPKISSLALNAYVGYMITGLIWGSWHIAYWIFILGSAQIQLATGQNLTTFIPLAILNLMVVSIFYGELRLLTNSVWPAFIMHTIGNALIDPLITQGLVHLTTGSFLAPLYQAILTPVFFLAAGIWLHQHRMRKQMAG
jgi:membrane protease YdiL (CAAX protease family)